jgi:hypothetical protein
MIIEARTHCIVQTPAPDRAQESFMKRGLLYLLDPSMARQFTSEPIYRKVFDPRLTVLHGFL